MKKTEKAGNLATMFLVTLLCLMVIGFLGFIGEDFENANSLSERIGLDLTAEDENSSIYEMLSSGYTSYLPNPTPFTLTQPDGTKFEARNVGEVIGGHTETMDGYTILEDENSWWTYAAKGDKGLLIPTRYKVRKVNPETIPVLIKHLANDYPELEVSENSPFDRNRGTRAPPRTGTWRGIAIMLEFPDESFDTTPELHDQAYFENLLNGTSGSTLRTYYQEVSYGVFDIWVDVVGPYMSSHDYEYYGENGAGRDDANGPVYEMAREAVSLSDPDVDFSEYDMDTDNVIDALFIIHAGVGEEEGGGSHGSNAVWSHKWNIMPGESVDGVIAGPYSTEPESGEIGVFAHEFGHILGLPDLYDIDYSSMGIGEWGIMAGGSWGEGGTSPAHFCAWSKIQLGWVEPIIVTSDLSLFQIEIPPVENNSIIYKIWAHDPSQNTNEYFLIENRQQIGFDSSLPGNGTLIWHIDDSRINNNDETHYLVDLEEADGDQELEEKGGPSQATDPWKNDLIGFRNDTTPNSTSYNGSYTGVWVWNFSNVQPNGNMSIGFNEIYSGPLGIIISDPQTNSTILPVYDFILTDTDFPDEDVGVDNEGNNGSYILEWRENGTTDPWEDTPAQTMISWEDGRIGKINCTMLTEGFWDFRVRIYDEEGHLFYTPEVYNVAVPTKIPPIADAGADNITDVLADTVLDGSASTDNSGYIAWFNWSFGDGTFLNGTQSIVVHNWTDPGNYTVILNVSDSFGNWNIDIVNITVVDMGAPVTTIVPDNPRYRENPNDWWNVTSTSGITLNSVDNYVGVNFTWYILDGVYFVYTGAFNLVGYSEGPHNLTVGAEDNVGNNETGNYNLIIVDDTPPTTNISVGYPKYRSSFGDIWNVSNSTIFTINSWDEYAGVDLTWYSIDGNLSFGDTFNLEGYGESLHIINWSVTDHVGNLALGNITVRIDKTPPTSDIVLGDPKYRGQPVDRWNFTTSTELSITNATDGTGIGLNYTWYTVDGFFYVYSGNFTLSPGLHLVAWGAIDFLNLNETGNIIEIFVDDEPPVTTMIVGDPNFGSSPTYVASSTQLSLSVTDGMGSGTVSTLYRINGGSWTLYSGPFNFSSSGLYIIDFYSTDNIGFIESIKTYDVAVDKLPPVTSISAGDPKYGMLPQYVDSTTSFTLTATDDAESGVESTWYRIDSGSWILYTGPFTISNTGPHTIYYNSTDHVAHHEVPKSHDVIVDNLAPSITLTIGEPKLGSSPTNVGIQTPFNFTANDGTGSGVASIWYNIDATGWVLYTGNFTIASPGDHIIYYYASDNLGHDGLNEQYDIFVDTSAPTTTLNVGDPKYGSAPTYVDTFTQFNLTASDGPGVGVDSIWFKINSGSWMRYTDNFTLPSSGAYTIYFNATDILGQVEITQNYDVVVDDSPPVTTILVGDPKYGSSPVYVNTSTYFTLTTSDGTGSGVSFVKYRIDGSPWVTYSGNFQIFNDGDHKIEFYSSDNMGHDEAIRSFNVTTETQPPFTTIDVGVPRFGSSPTYINSITPITLISSDGSGSGVGSIWYRIDFGTRNLYTGDFTVSSPGIHTIYYNATDNLGQHEQLRGISVFVDDDLPETNITIGDPKYGSSPINVNLGTSISLSADDGTGSGVASTWYKIDSGSLTLYTGSFFLLSEGLHTVYYNSSDNLNQNENVKSIELFCDSSAPQTNLNVGDPKFRENGMDIWNITLDTPLELISADSDTDVYWFEINGKYYEGTAFDLGDYNLGEGFYTISWGALDLLGNNETGNSQTIFLDDSTPQTVITVGNPKYRDSINDDWIVTSSTDFYLYSDYEKSGVKTIWYTIDGDYYEGAVFDLSLYPDGVHTITWGSCDNLDHNETGNSIDVVLNLDLGFIDMVIGEPKYRADTADLFNVTTQTPFTLTMFNQYADVEYTWYTINGNYLTGTSFTLEGYEEGLRTIEFGTMDIFGNSETWDTIMVYLDSSPPTTIIDLSDPKYRNSENGPWKVRFDTIFTLSSSDMYSGVASIWYKIDGEKFQGITFDLNDYEDGIYEIKWGASDNLDFSEKENKMDIIIDNTPPVIEIRVGQPNSTIGDVIQITSETKITLVSLDIEPTIRYYSLDGGAKFSTYVSAFTVPQTTTMIIFYGEDPLGNKANDSYIEIFVNNNDYDDDGKVDLIDEDDDNDGILDYEEDLNQNGILDEGESDPRNADTDSDGYIDSEDKYPQDASRYRDPTDWEKLPIVGGFEQGLCINLIIIGIILLIVILYLFRRYRMFRAKSSWKKESEENGNPQNNK